MVYLDCDVFACNSEMQDIESFSTMFLNYDLLARKWGDTAIFIPLGKQLLAS